MDPSRVSLAWDHRGHLGYRVRGPLRYDDRTRTFFLPVHLTPGGVHRITAGKRDGGPFRTESFESVDDVAAEPFSWSFTTAEPGQAAGAVPPRVTSVDPPPDTEQALLTPIRVTFDRPMDPSSYGVTGPIPAAAGREPELLDHPDYAPESRTFTLLLKLPHNWNGEVRLVGFRSAEGAEVAPVAFAYRTRREPLAQSLRAKVEHAAQDDPGLVQFLERLQAARRDRPGLREEVLTTSTYGLEAPGWHQSYVTSGATFAVRGDRRFYGEVDEIMGIPFRVGCDGETCWFRRNGELTTLPFKEVAENNLLFGDPFGAISRASAREVIRERSSRTWATRTPSAAPAAVSGRGMFDSSRPNSSHRPSTGLSTSSRSCPPASIRAFSQRTSLIPTSASRFRTTSSAGGPSRRSAKLEPSRWPRATSIGS